MRPKFVAIKFLPDGEQEILAVWIDEKEGRAWIGGASSMEQTMKKIVGADGIESEEQSGRMRIAVPAEKWDELLTRIREERFVINGGVKSFRRIVH